MLTKTLPARSGALALAALTVALLAATTLTRPAMGQEGTSAVPTDPPGATRVAVTFSGGYDTDPQDRGRPVVLVAGALGVPPEVFREAFRHVRPAPAGTEPDPQQVRRNKAALMDALSRYGVTNDRLDTVSNYYRYVRSRGELWPTRPARAYAIVSNGAVVRYVITDAGSGYSSAPAITVPGVPTATGKARLAFSKRFDQNGSLSAITTN